MQYPANKPVADFVCQQCEEEFELKAKDVLNPTLVQNRIMDGAYATMIERITSLRNPHLLFMTHYRAQVANLFMIPKFFFVPEIIEKRKPLAITARRAGWIGCNINIAKIPKTGRISMITNGLPRDPQQVVSEYRKAELVRISNIDSRGWLLDVLCCIEQLPAEFTLRDVYSFTEWLATLHPNNNNIQAKIRQQLQVLRDRNFIQFTAKGVYHKL